VHLEERFKTIDPNTLEVLSVKRMKNVIEIPDGFSLLPDRTELYTINFDSADMDMFEIK
jgi:hypothetical protein